MDSSSLAEKTWAKTLGQALFILLLLVCSIMTAMGFELNFARLESLGFWVEVALTLVVSMIMYNMSYSIDNKNRRLQADTFYYRTLYENKRKIQHIYDNALIPKLDIAVDAENEETRIKKCNRILHKVTSRICHSDINYDWTEGEIDSKCSEFRLPKSKVKKLKAAINKIISGRVRYPKVTTNDILIDKDGHHDDVADMTSRRVMRLRIYQNIARAAIFTVFAIIQAVISWQLADYTDLILTIVTNCTIFFGAWISAIYSSATYIKIRGKTLDLRNKFLIRRMGILDDREYIFETE